MRSAAHPSSWCLLATWTLNKVKALDQGADDFVDKPFAMAELLARLRACLRRSEVQERAAEYWQHGPVTVDLHCRVVLMDGQDVSFTPREYDLLAVLSRNAGVILTHRQLLTAVWGSDHAQDLQYLRVYLGLIRQKLGPSGSRIVLTASRLGYRVADTAAQA